MKKMYACSRRYGGITVALVTVLKETSKTITLSSVDKIIAGNHYDLWGGYRYSKGVSYVFFSTWLEVQAWLHDAIGTISDSIAQEQARLQELIELVDKKEEEL